MFIKLTKISPQGAFPTFNVNVHSVTAVESIMNSAWNETTSKYDEAEGTIVHLLGNLSWLISESQDQVLKLIEEAL